MTSATRLAVVLGIGIAIAVATSLQILQSPAMESRTPVDVASLGPQVGETVPSFALTDQSGATRTLESVLGPNGAMILFHRSADW